MSTLLKSSYHFFVPILHSSFHSVSFANATQNCHPGWGAGAATTRKKTRKTPAKQKERWQRGGRRGKL